MELWTIGDLMNYFRASDKTVYRWLNAGKIPGAFKMTGTWYVHVDVFFEGMRDKATNHQRGETKSRHL